MPNDSAHSRRKTDLRELTTILRCTLLAGSLFFPSCLTAAMWGVRPACGTDEVTQVTVDRRATARGRHPRFWARENEPKTAVAIDFIVEEGHVDEWDAPIPRSCLLILEPRSKLERFWEVVDEPRQIVSVSLHWSHYRDYFDGVPATARLAVAHEAWEGAVRASWSPRENRAEESAEKPPDIHIDLQETAVETSTFQAVWRGALTPATVAIDIATLPILIPLLIALS